MRSPLFRRNRSDSSSTVTQAEPVDATRHAGGAGGKGRPTPTRKEAEAAARARARPARTRKEQNARERSVRSERSQKVREAMKTGDERYLLPRDKGPVRRFTRDFVDTRFTVVELMIPLLIVTMILGYSGNPTLMALGNTVLLATVAVIVVDLILLRMRLRKQIAARFPTESTKGVTFYALTRAMQMRFMRMPKTQVKIGAQLPEHYR